MLAGRPLRATTAKPVDDGGTSQITAAVAASPTTTMLSPVTVSARPNRSTSRPPITDEAAEPRANEVTTRPDCSGV